VGFIFLLGIVGSSIWVAIDASKLGARRGALGGGMLDMGVASWTICCLIVWIVSFPCYLVARSKLIELRKVSVYGAPQLYTQPVYAPPQYSPDGRWWWTGQQWVAVQAPPPYVG
jgi:hypothetical protein